MEYFVEKDFQAVIFLVVTYLEWFIKKIHLKYTFVYEK